jgi:Domain of unknown function (DUF4432)
MHRTWIAAGFAAACLTACPALADNSQVLLDAAQNLSTANWSVSSAEWGGGPKWSVQLRTLHGGRQEGVQVIEVDNGAMTFAIVPTRGFEIWKAQAGDLRLGWDSPVSEIIHPSLVNLESNGGHGWTNGFGGWVVRGGLASFGDPVMDGSQQLTLHGHVDYIPASFVSVRYEAGPVPRLVFKGVVKDEQVFGPQLQLTSEISTPIGKPEVAFDDVIANTSDAPQEMEALYHTNFGTPLLGAGAEFVAPVKHVAPINAASAAGGLEGWSHYTGPHAPGYAAQVFLMQLYADAAGETAAMLKAPGGAQGALFRFNIHELPAMSLWKNEAPAKAGYVTGLEPGTGYPYARTIERAAGRVPVLKGGESYHIHLAISALTSKAEVSAAEGAIKKLQTGETLVQKTPLAPQ